VAERGAGGERWREARCADITILIPSRTSLPMLEAALAARDLPYRVDTSTLVFDSPEVRDLLTVLLAVDDPADALATVGALRSGLFACPDTELFDWVHAGGSWDHRLAGTADAAAARDAAPRVAAALATLAGWHDDARWCEPATLLERIVRERDVFALALTHRRPRDVWRRVRFLIDQARNFAEVDGGHVRAFVRWAELQRNEGSRVPEPLLPELDDDAVRIMTFHGAKGLEFPIVVLSGLTTRPNPPSSGPQVRWDAAGVPQISIGKAAATDRFDVLNEFESEMDADEKLRLLYVGATRARDHLFVSTHRLAKDAGSADATFAVRLHRACREHASPLTSTWSAPPASPAVEPVESSSETVPSAVVPSAAARSETAPAAVAHDIPSVGRPDAIRDFAAWCEARSALLARAAGERTVWSATAVAAALAPPHEPVARPVPSFDTEAVDAPDALRWVGGTALGRAVHAALEHAEHAEHADPGAPARRAALVARAAAAEGVDPALVAMAVEHVLAAPGVQAALAAPLHWRELELDVPIGPAIVHGVVDLLAEIDGELVLFDYKTDRVASDALDGRVAAYAPQLAAYALAIEARTGRRVARAVLVFVGPEGAVEREVPDLAAVCARVQALLTGPVAPSGRPPEG
jgi:ATP-dependent exoDNAse (exonuclease V) beta subunit